MTFVHISFNFYKFRFPEMSAMAMLLTMCLAAAADVPQKIFTFWDTAPPPSVLRSMDTWRRQNPIWEVHLLSPKNLEHFLSSESLDFIRTAENMTEMGPTYLSDLVRVEVLAENGGVWLDATVALTKPLSAWIPSRPSTCFYGFDLDFRLLAAKAVNLRSGNWTSHFEHGRLKVPLTEPMHMPETWAFGAKLNCSLMMAFKDMQRSLIQHPLGYAAALKEQTMTLPEIYRKWMPHLGGSYSLYKAVQQVKEAHLFYAAEDWAFRHLDWMPKPWLFGPSLPLDYSTDYQGGPIFALAAENKSVGPLMKLRRFERCALDAIIAFRTCLSPFKLKPSSIIRNCAFKGFESNCSISTF